MLVASAGICDATIDRQKKMAEGMNCIRDRLSRVSLDKGLWTVKSPFVI